MMSLGPKIRVVGSNVAPCRDISGIFFLGLLPASANFRVQIVAWPPRSTIMKGMARQESEHRGEGGDAAPTQTTCVRHNFMP